jgi:hypothetical protein
MIRRNSECCLLWSWLMLLAAYYGPIFRPHLFCIAICFKKTVIVIIRLMLSVKFWPKVITLSGAYYSGRRLMGSRIMGSIG